MMTNFGALYVFYARMETAIPQHTHHLIRWHCVAPSIKEKSIGTPVRLNYEQVDLGSRHDQSYLSLIHI